MMMMIMMVMAEEIMMVVGVARCKTVFGTTNHLYNKSLLT